MSDLYWLADEQMDRLYPFFPKSHGRPRVDDRRVLSGIIFVNRNGLRWRDGPGNTAPQDALQPLEALEYYGDLHPHDGWTRCRKGRASDDHD